MSEMVERVARAMWQAEWDRAKTHERAANEAAGRDVYVSYVPKWEDCDLLFMGYARAAIEAMREPTGAMVETAVEEAGEYRFGGCEALACWQAMIDAALAEGRAMSEPETEGRFVRVPTFTFETETVRDDDLKTYTVRMTAKPGPPYRIVWLPRPPATTAPPAR